MGLADKVVPGLGSKWSFTSTCATWFQEQCPWGYVRSNVLGLSFAVRYFQLLEPFAKTAEHYSPSPAVMAWWDQVTQEIRQQNGTELSNLLLALKICLSVFITVLATDRADKNGSPCLTDPSHTHTSCTSTAGRHTWTLLSLVPHKCTIASNLSHYEPSFSPLSIFPLGLSLPSPCILLFLSTGEAHTTVNRVQPQNADGGCF